MQVRETDWKWHTDGKHVRERQRGSTSVVDGLVGVEPPQHSAAERKQDTVNCDAALLIVISIRRARTVPTMVSLGTKAAAKMSVLSPARTKVIEAQAASPSSQSKLGRKAGSQLSKMNERRCDGGNTLVGDTCAPELGQPSVEADYHTTLRRLKDSFDHTYIMTRSSSTVTSSWDCNAIIADGIRRVACTVPSAG
jgi:hypothetical protein